MAELRATPYANPLTGLSNDAVQGLLAFMQDKRRTQQLQGLGNLLESTGIPKTLERAAYADSPKGLLDALTNVNRANVPLLKSETAEAAMTLAPFAAPANRALMQVTKGLPVGASIKNVGDELIYHGTSPKAAKAIEKSGFDVTKSADGTIWFTSNPNIGEVAASGKGAVVKRFLDEKKMKLGGWDETDKFSTDELIQKGFDGLKLKDSKTGEITYQIFNPEKLAVNKSFKYPQQETLDKAQRNAALPVEKGGLGLPKDNTPEMRAEAMGFDTNVYHGSRKDFTSFRDDQPVFAAENPDIAKLYGNIIYPLKLRGEQLNVSDLSDKGSGYFAENLSKKLGLSNQEDLLKNSDIRERELINAIKDRGFDRLKITDMSDMGGVQTQYAIPANSSNIRSRFAAFDPMRRNEPDILAGVLPLGLLADEEQRKKLYELMPSLLGQ